MTVHLTDSASVSLFPMQGRYNFDYANSVDVTHILPLENWHQFVIVDGIISVAVSLPYVFIVISYMTTSEQLVDSAYIANW